MKFIRVVVFYLLFLFVTLFITGIFLEQLGDGLFVLVTFTTPGLIVWWYEKVRARRSEASTLSMPDPSGQGGTNQGTPHVERQQEQQERTRRTESSRTVTRHRPTAERFRTGQGWVPRGEVVSIRGREIAGMVYVGTAPLLSTYGRGEKCRAYIDPSLAVAPVGSDKDGRGMPYWPGYSSISPECRATYLEWLANGATDSSYNPGYMFLYFYGLERRFFVEDPSIGEKTEILAEVRRLVGLYSTNHSAQRYLGAFTQFALVATTATDEIEPVFDNPGWDVPFSVKFAIGMRIERGDNLSADWVLSWFLCSPDKVLRTAGKRCRDEFMALFRLRFDERFAQGLKVNKPRKSLQVSYQAASGEFNATVSPAVNGRPVPDISGIRKPIEIAQEIADEVMEDLEKFSRFLGRTPNGRGSIEGHALLPTELRQIFPSEELEKLKAWAAGVVAQGGLVSISEVVERLEGNRPEKLGKRQLTGAADALARIGFGMAPDPRFALRSPRLDEPVVIFDLGGPVEHLETVSTKYRTALMELALASLVAQADAVMSELEWKNLDDQTRSVDGLTETERRRLRANLAWFVAVPPDIALLRRRLKEGSPDQQSTIRAALIAAAHADGIVRPEEVAEIEKIYRAVGLDPDLVYSDLHAGEIHDAPVRVRSARTGVPGEVIPEEPLATRQNLDAERIAKIRHDTDRVSAVLSEIFTLEPDVEEVADSPAPSTLNGLDEKLSSFVREIIARPHWTEDDFTELAKRHQLMVAGALETVNEWSFGVYDEALLEEYEGYNVSADLADALADEFEKENSHFEA